MAPANSEGFVDLPFLQTRSDAVPFQRLLRNAALSVAAHLLIAWSLYSLPDVVRPIRAPIIVADVRKAVKLVAPRFTDLTQKDPNQGKVTRTVDVRSANSTPQPAVPRVIPPPVISAPPAPPPAPAVIPTPVIEQPKVEVASASAPAPAVGNSNAPPAPVPAQPPASAKPKLSFESVAGASVRSQSQNPAITPPKNTVEELARTANRPSGGGGTTVGDELDQIPNVTPLGQMPAPGRMGSNLQLLSDPSGVDFKPYLVQVLAAVRHNWMAVIPESARLGRRGLVTVQFIIDREGKVPKLVIASPSGTAAFDRAAVAGVSMSHPFPALPNGYKGDEIRLQLAFSYNMSR